MIKQLVDRFRDWIENLFFLYDRWADEKRRSVVVGLIDNTRDKIDQAKREKEDYELQLEGMGLDNSQRRKIARAAIDLKFKIEKLEARIVAYDLEIAQLDNSLKLLGKILNYREPRSK